MEKHEIKRALHDKTDLIETLKTSIITDGANGRWSIEIMMRSGRKIEVQNVFWVGAEKECLIVWYTLRHDIKEMQGYYIPWAQIEYATTVAPLGRASKQLLVKYLDTADDAGQGKE